MKLSLKYYTLKYIVVALLLIIAVWAALFYAFILDEVYDNVDDGLKNRKIQLIKAVYKDEKLLNNVDFEFNEFKIVPISEQECNNRNKFYNRTYYMEYDDDDEPYRVLETCFTDQFGGHRKLVIRTSTVEEDDLIYDLSIALVVLYFFLVLSILFVNGFLLNKAWRPFYAILEKLRNYQFGEKTGNQRQEYSIKEFEQLDEEIDEMIRRNELVFDQQKKFIENASHELQTPLAIMINKIDLSVQDGNIDESTVHLLMDIKGNLTRMTGLNKSLLMLSKIENNQFSATEKVDFNNLIKDVIEAYKDFTDHKGISIEIVERGNFSTSFNSDLAHILISNLLKNAIKYNIPNGFIQVIIERNWLTMMNPGQNHPLDQDRIFSRFYKQSADHSSTGLGLSIVHSIIRQYPDLSIAYRFEDEMHQLIISKK
ncbi:MULTISPECIES: sensor histidine kinase [Chryseobacterium]|uniref:histidine kinase n=1 Tax=Chryseobacterium camelliae TaxID=1265445 RepID=A0ABU0TLM0_9FLAO|nr:MULTISPECIES: HAMP domain-containing sensor histidine kinase [Chryseobacterium]MDT3408196.1 signal transduction histidine kinase [Pseudacidovorax intermedius]MDQ1097950.1 signal transduction histidine kinase [Chryseobacterium camelliae]MDQ1101881.1 signal transduction histidine kinase [Chryseobacterium sp. SORGH_AS_1048]MDR6085321.1 signal transduction histidine kinase [Chryseobacterium sp. SORGH_AS_0909]MDR6129678.1 signal transduction histidine kinase [Chryseobacterium sp. SORGH_AS_1175]